MPVCEAITLTAETTEADFEVTLLEAPTLANFTLL